MKNKFLKSLRILLVEDEEKLCSLLKNAIGDSFHSFSVARDGFEGVEMYKKLSPDIVITDIMMPNKTGLEMAKEIKELDKNVPIIILSAFSERDNFLTAIDVGVVKYFLKPFDPDELLEYIVSLESALGDRTIELKDNFVYNKTKKGLYKKGRYISITKKEKLFIELLLQKYEDETYTLSYEEIKEQLWSDHVSDERVRTFVRRVREKTSKDLISNIKGEGYQILLSGNK
ncbi:response regulator transcription factor [Sulfurimonas sp.]